MRYFTLNADASVESISVLECLFIVAALCECGIREDDNGEASGGEVESHDGVVELAFWNSRLLFLK
jgi:hypothetical protein